MNLNHQFLIAMPEMADPMFAGTLTYILQHDEQGAFGLIVNRPIKLTLGEVYESIEWLSGEKHHVNKSVYHGGPVSSEQGFVLHRPTERVWDACLFNNELCITTSQDVLEAIALGEGPTDFLFCLGYSGWTAGQLEEELKQNAWLTVEADSQLIFSDDEQGKYKKALAQLGVDISNLSGSGGLA